MKWIITSLIFFFSLTTFSQWGYKDENIASRFKPGGMWYFTGLRPGKDDKSRKYDRLIFDITYALPQSDSAIKTTTPGSFGWNLNTMFDVPLTAGNTVSFGWGFSYRSVRMGHKNLLVEDQANERILLQNNPNFSADKQVLGSHSIAVPVELRFRAAKWKHLKFHIGGYAGYQFQTYNKIWLAHNQVVVKDKNLYDTNPLIYGVHARFGFRNFALFGDYRISKTFENKQSTPLNFLTVGLSVSLF